MTRRLVITADDLGRDRDGTATVLSLLADGSVTSASLLAVTPHTAEAAAAARAVGLQPHLHLAVTSDRGPHRWRPLSPGTSLRDARGLLREDPHGAELALDPGELRVELDAQLAQVHALGLRPQTADSHAGTLYGLRRGDDRLLVTVLRWCADNGLGFRLPRRPLTPSLDPMPEETARRHHAAVRLADELGVALPASILTAQPAAPTQEGVGPLRAQLSGRLRRLPEGTSELFLHPSAAGAEVPGERVLEAELLRDPGWRAALRAERIELVEQW
ncbi:ChbG/HpnK family deacetylase [Brachybacterium sp. AOP43-C2-M15]|uniref:ChbG/HpnK family deacetylase n=1 Tax=Brachybacterium sp. AOP43-C2-M15 TaxID=3457661 RepID=UPI004033CCB0